MVATRIIVDLMDAGYISSRLDRGVCMLVEMRRDIDTGT